VPPAASRTRRPAVIAHRGGGREVPENTWSAVEHVAALGLEWMETDLRLTADGVARDVPESRGLCQRRIVA